MKKHHYNQSRFISSISISLVTIFLFTFSLYGQQATPTPEKDTEEIKLEADKRKSLLRKEIAENNKAALAAELPGATPTPLAGQTTVNDGAVIESQMIAYIAMGKVAGDVVTRIKDKVGTNNLAILNSQDVNLLLSYKITKNQVSIIKHGYCNLLNINNQEICLSSPGLVPESVGAGYSIVKSFLGGFVDLTSLFRTNVDIKGTSFDIEEGPFVAKIFRAGRQKDGFGTIKLYYPSLFPTEIKPDEESKLLTELDRINIIRGLAERILSEIDETTKAIDESAGKSKTLNGSKKQAESQVKDSENGQLNLLKVYCGKAKLGIPCAEMPKASREKFLDLGNQIKKANESLKTLIEDLAKEKDNKTELEKKIKGLWKSLKLGSMDPDNPNKLLIAGLITQLKTRNAQFDRLIDSLVMPAANGLNPLTSFIRAEGYLRAMPEGSHWLQLKVIKAGGNNRIKTNLILDVFRGGNRISHSGGVIAQYILFDGGGNVVDSDVMTQYVNYTKSKKIKELEVELKQND